MEFTIPVEPADTNEARKQMAELTDSVEQHLFEVFSSKYEIQSSDMTDSEEIFGSLGAASADDLTLSREFSLYQGSKSGASVSFTWHQTDRQRVTVQVQEWSRLEDTVFGACAVGGGLLGVGAAFFFLRLRLLLLILGGMAGFALGLGLYFIFANPLLKIVTKSEKAQKKKMVRELASSVRSHLQEYEACLVNSGDVK